MSEQKQFGPWVVEKEIYNHVFLVSKNGGDRLGALKISRNGNGKEIGREAEILSTLDHPNIVKLIDCDIDFETPYLVTEYYRFGSLSFADLSEFGFSEKMKFFGNYCEGVAHCHSKGIGKYDHKLGNIVLANDGKTPIIIDFGSSTKHLNETTIHNDMFGLASFLWELIEGKRVVEYYSDPNINSRYTNHRERYLLRKIHKLNDDLEAAKQEKVELPAHLGG